MSTAGITLTSGIRNNLFALQQTQSLMEQTQHRLSTGKRVNSAVDDPVNYFTALEHVQRAEDLSSCKDGMSEAIQTITAANNGVEGVMHLIASAQSLAQSALSTDSDQRAVLGAQYDETLDQMDAITGDSEYKGINLLGGASQTLEVKLNENGSSSLTINGFDATATGLSIDKVNTTSATSSSTPTAVPYYYFGVTTSASTTSGAISVTLNGTTLDQGIDYSLYGTNYAPGNSMWYVMIEPQSTQLMTGDSVVFDASTGTHTTFTVDDAALNSPPAADSSTPLGTASPTSPYTVTASTAVSAAVATDITNNFLNYRLVGATSGAVATLIGVDGSNIVSGSNWQGVPFISGEEITLEYYSGGVNWMNGDPVAAASSSSSSSSSTTTAWTGSDDIQTSIDQLNQAKTKLFSQSQLFQTDLSILTTRQDFTEGMVNILEDGAANLTNADMNEESANMLMLQTRQSLGTTSLSLASQASQSVLRLF